METSRAANPALQRVADAYPQKRTSYRRPPDAQPTAVMAKSIPSNTARVAAHRRRPSQQIPPPTTGPANEVMPAAPDVPRAPPSSYKDPNVPKPGSRASRDPAIQVNTSLKQATVQTPANRLYELRSPPYAPIEPLSGNIGRRTSQRTPSAPSVPDRSPLQKLEGKLDDISKEERRARILDAELAAQEKVEAANRARRAREAAAREAAAREAAVREQREAAVREQREAAVREAVAREQREAAAREQREAAAREQRVVSQPVPRPEKTSRASTRTASSRRHVSGPVQSKATSPAISDFEPEDSFIYDLSEPWDPSSAQTAPAPAPAPASAPASAPAPQQEALQNRQRAPAGHLNVPGATIVTVRNPSLKGKESTGTARGAGSPHNPTAAVPAQNTHAVHRKPVAGPAGLGLVGVGDALAVAEAHRSGSRGPMQPSPVVEAHRSGSRGPMQPSPIAKEPASHEKRSDSRSITAAQMEMQQQSVNDQRSTSRGLGYPQPPFHGSSTVSANRKSVTFSEIDSDVQQPVAPDSSHHQHHQHHHHFRHDDEPERTYVKTPMLEDWRGAPTATLTIEDQDLDGPIRSNSINQSKWERNQSSQYPRATSHADPMHDGYVDESTMPTAFNPPLYLKCGPLLRYTGLRRDRSVTGNEREIWRGSVMIVTTDAQSSYRKPPTLRLFKQPMDIPPPPPVDVDTDSLDPAYIDHIEGQSKVSRTGRTLYVKPVDELVGDEDLSRLEDDTGLFSSVRSPSDSGLGGKSSRIHKRDGEKLGKMREIAGIKLHAERGVTFWRFNLEVELGSIQTRIAYRINSGPAIGFWIPAKGESMNIMFHSCNGFSISVNPNQFCGPDPMWRDVLNNHSSRPFHVMLGGGDQIYNDAAMRQTTLFKQWTESRNPLQKHNTSFSEEMQNELEQFYLDRYAMWFSQGLFGMANSQIPMVNIWDDHDIIDGYGSYPHHFMQTPVFTGIGAVAFKYYMLFQHQSITAETEKTEPSWLLGKEPGPYIKERSRSVFMQLGRQVAFLGLDCRTERKRDEIITIDSYDNIFDRLEDEIIKGETKHLIVLLGIPIAYPRLNFLENVLTSRLMDPIKWIGRTGLLGNFINKFDGGVEILDDLDDHWTAKHHKEERNWFIKELQHIAATKSVRITILGGDVHLAAVGQFYTNKKLGVPKDKDHRYMPNIVSSAIVNTPPPDLMADVLNKRNKVHHLDEYTDEDLIPIFTHGVDGNKRNNNCLLPHRNWCSIREWKPGFTPPGTPSPPVTAQDNPGLTRTLSDYAPRQMARRLSGEQPSRPGRGRGPPLSYRNNPAYAAADGQQIETQHHLRSSFSPDRSEPERPARSRRSSLSSLFRRRPSVDSARPDDFSPSAPPRGRNSTSNERPSNFHRRPSVLTKKGPQRQGNYINLEGGLDICLNLEVSQHDPAGITTPYRLIVPALDYTAPPPGPAEKEHHKSIFAGIFGGGGRRNRRVGDNDESGSGSELGEISDEDQNERAPQRYQAGPEALVPGFESQKKRNAATAQAPPDAHLRSGYHTNLAAHIGPEQTGSAQNDRRQNIDVANNSGSSAWESAAAKRHVSAPHSATTTRTMAQTTTQTTVLPSRSNTTSRRQPGHSSSHQPQPSSETKVYTKSMGGILNQHGDAQFGHEAHVLAHMPARSKRDSYPPHTAIVGAGPNSPYRRGSSGMQAPDYFTSGGHDRRASGHAPAGTSAGGATAGGMPRGTTGGTGYAMASPDSQRRTYPSYPTTGLNPGQSDDDESDSYEDDESPSGEERERSQESFVPPKPKKMWKVWR